MSKAQIKIVSTMKKEGILLAIASIQRRGAALDNDIQATALAIAAHIHEHREVTLAVKLFNAMPMGSRRLALVHWFIKHAFVKVNMDKDTKKDFPLQFDKEAAARNESEEAKALLLTAGAKLQWFDCKKEKELTDEFNPNKELEAFQKKVAGWVKSGKISAEAVADVLAVKITPVAVEEPTLGDVAGE